MAIVEESRSAELLTADLATINPLDAIRLLRSAGKALFAQASLHAQLARVEWTEEKSRLQKMLAAALLGLACALCVMLIVGALALAFSWGTPYRIPVALALIAVYAAGVAVAWRRFKTLSALSGQAFAATREELAIDLAMIRSKL